jgi:hypothetical protein
MILDALKKRLYRENDRHPRRWLKELPAMVWGLRTQPSRNTGIFPYFMVFGSKAVLPANITFQSLLTILNTNIISSINAQYNGKSVISAWL